MKSQLMTLLIAAVFAGIAGGCCSAPAPETSALNPPSATVVKTAGKITVDGKLDEACWQAAPEYSLGKVKTDGGELPVVQAIVARDKFEKLFVRCLYDDKYLYIACRAEDDDVYACTQVDQEYLFRDCDVLEVFIKPVKANYYWELYVTAAGNKTSCFYPSHGVMNQAAIAKDKLLTTLLTAAQVDGTLNNWQDEDKGWTAEMAIPLAELGRYGIAFAPGQEWTIFFARYNYSKNFRKWQYSGYPVPPVLSSHLLENYAPIVFK